MLLTIPNKVSTIERLKVISTYSESKYVQQNINSRSEDFQNDAYLSQFKHRNNYFIRLLSKEQNKIFCELHEKINLVCYNNLSRKTGFVGVIDADPGTGKTFFVASFATTFSSRVIYMVYNGRLVNNINGFHNMEAMSNCSFLMRTLKANYFSAIGMFMEKKRPLKTMLLYVESLAAKSIIPEDVKCIIIDEYTVCSPWLIVFLCLLARKKNLIVLFVGNFKQLNTIETARYIRCNNYMLALNLADDNWSLKELLRQEDDLSFKVLLNDITKIYDQYPKYKEIKMNFSILYVLYEHLRSKFLTTPDHMNNIYLSSFHRQITLRLKHLEEIMKNKNIPFMQSRFYYSIVGSEVSEFSICPSIIDLKFPQYVLLSVGLQYFYALNKDEQRLVYLTDISVYRNGSPKAIHVEDVQTKEVFVVRRELCNTLVFHKEHLKWFEKHLDSFHQQSGLKFHIYQFPLRNFTSTYHAVQGFTFPSTTKVDMNCDGDVFNSIYVGLTRIKTLNQLVFLETEKLMSLLVTEYKNDKYFYFVDPKHNYQLGRILQNNKFEWKRIIDSIFFTNNSMSEFYKVQREEYISKAKMDKNDNQLMISNLQSLILELNNFGYK